MLTQDLRFKSIQFLDSLKVIWPNYNIVQLLRSGALSNIVALFFDKHIILARIITTSIFDGKLSTKCVFKLRELIKTI